MSTSIGRFILYALIQANMEFHTSRKTVAHDSGHCSIFCTLAWIWCNSLDPSVTQLRRHNWQFGMKHLCSVKEIIKAWSLQPCIRKFSTQYLVVAKNLLPCKTQAKSKVKMGKLRCIYECYKRRRRQTPATVTSQVLPYTLCRWDSDNCYRLFTYYKISSVRGLTVDFR